MIHTFDVKDTWEGNTTAAHWRQKRVGPNKTDIDGASTLEGREGTLQAEMKWQRSARRA